MSKTSRKLIFQQLQNIEKSGFPSLEDVLKSHLVSQQTQGTPDGFIHPSSLSKCPRYVWFHMNMIPYTNWHPHDPELQLTFDQGKAVEVMMFKRYFFEMNILVAEEKPIPENKHRVKGRCDVILWLDDEYYIVDIKTANNNSFTHGVPYKSYEMQVAAYMIYLGIDKGKVFYYNKDNSQTIESNISITDQVVHDTRELINKFNTNFEHGIVPDVSKIRPKCTDKSCAYFSECMKYPEAEVRLPR